MQVRAAEDDELDAVVAVCAEALGWGEGDPNEEWFRWKHRRNPFGPSPVWVAVDDDSIVAVRTFMRWRFRRGDETVDAVRAVDTATLPSHQRQGLFSRLTLHGLGELERQGVAFVFNTPNDQSLPGYLSMGWRELGPAPISVRPAGLVALTRTLRARTPAEKWSLPCDVGDSLLDVLAAEADAVSALASSRDPDVWQTDRSVDYLRWRYGFEPLRYRVFTDGAVSDGLIVFRLRSRGPATECVVAEVLLPDADARRRARRLLGRLARAVRADHLVIAEASAPGLGWIPAGRLGPIVTVRDVAGEAPASIADLSLAVGDLELF